MRMPSFMSRAHVIGDVRQRTVALAVTTSPAPLWFTHDLAGWPSGHPPAGAPGKREGAARTIMQS